MEKQALSFVYYFVYIMDLIVKSIILIGLSPALLVITILNWHWRKNIKRGDSCYLKSIIDDKLIKCVVTSIRDNNVVSVFTNDNQLKTVNVNKLNKYSL